MKMYILLLITVLIGLGGCTPDQGDFKYLAKKPAIKATILSHRIESGEFGSTRLKLTGVTEEKDPFPVKNYTLQLRYEAHIESKKVFSSALTIEMKDGKGSFEDSISLSGIKADPEDKPTVTFVVIRATWYPRTSADVEIETR